MTDLLLLATEAGPGGANPGATIAVVIMLVALVAFAAAYFVVGPGRRRGPKLHGDIPLAMRPYHSDRELETTGMERAMSWGVALSVFAAVFLPLYWVLEPQRINAQRDVYYEQDVTLGRDLFAQNCATCHGANAEGGFAPHPDPDVDAPWPAPALDNIVARYADSEVVLDVEDFTYQTIAQGRPGTPMPAWGSDYQGAMNDQQIDAIISYLLSIQTGEVEPAQAEAAGAEAMGAASGADLFQDNCARCHGVEAQGRVGPQLTNVFERFGADPDDPASVEEAAAAVRTTIVQGRQVPAVGVMPPFGDSLTPQAITKLVEYLRSIQEYGGDGPSFGQVGGPPQPSPSATASEEGGQ